jgi:REP element-mobilizing transposase RayT
VPFDSRARPHSNHLRAGRWSETLTCYAITKCVAGRNPILAQPLLARLVLSSLDHLRTIQEIRLLAFCIMPDHYHVILFPVGHKSLSEIMSSVGKYTARRLNQLLERRGEFWEEGYYDHRCRDDDDIEALMTYIEHNPVRADLATKAESWPFSSAHPSQTALLDREWYSQMR